MPNQSINCYDYPQYWDLAFRDETDREVDFFQQAFQKYCDPPIYRVLEPGCGGGRLVVEMAARGYDVTGIDLNGPTVRYLKRRLKRRGLKATVIEGDMTDFTLDEPVDAAFCTFNTFRHLTTEAAARQHLQAVAKNVRRGGIYILGFHMIPLDAYEEDEERWTAKHAATRVAMTVRVIEFDRRRRLETLRFCLRVRSGGRDLRLRSDYELRLYTATQVRRLFKSVPEWQLCDVYDFWYDIDEPLKLNDDMGDCVFILKRR